MSRRVSPLVACLACCLATAGQDDPVQKEIARARAAYDAALERLRQGLAAALDAREKAARDRGDKKAVDAVKAERDKLKPAGEPPWPLLTPAMRADLQRARGQVEVAYQRAVREYTRASRDTEAAAAEKALDEFKRSASAGAPFALRKLPAGPVKEGATFEGSFRAGKKLKSGGIGKTGAINDTFTLVVKSIDGDAFVGEWAWGKGAVSRVEGTIDKKGQFRFQFTKNLKGSSAAVDGAATGLIDPKAIKGQYVKASEGKVGLFEGMAKGPDR
jgi:hypothetical protein